MTNWFSNKEEEVKRLTDRAMKEYEHLVDSVDEDDVASFWLDSRHCIFGFINNNGEDDEWVEIHYELRDIDDEEEIVGDLEVLPTEDTSYDSIHKEIEAVIRLYLGE